MTADTAAAAADTVNVDALPPTQYLVMEVLVGRYRTGERSWSFPTRLAPALQALAAQGLITFHHNTSCFPPMLRARFTDLGKKSMFKPGSTYVSPYEKQLADARQAFKALVNVIGETSARNAGWTPPPQPGNPGTAQN